MIPLAALRRPPRRLRVEDFVPALRTRLLILQPTPFCNIQCSYCYLSRRDERSRMRLETLRLALRHLRDDGLLGEELDLVWHAGEPLVVPLAWYEEAFALVAEELGPGLQVSHAMQTNATLIDAAWCRFLRARGVQVGVSVDGPAPLHDRHRRTRSGQGTHAAVLRGMQQLRDAGVAFHAIAVVGAATLASDAEAFYAWFEEQGVNELGLNIDEAEGAHRCSSLAGREAAHGEFLQRLLLCAQHGRVRVREFEAAWQLLREPLPRWRWQHHIWPQNTQLMPLAMLTLGHDGRFGSFSPELLGQPWPAYGDFVLGNVHQGGFLQALQGDAFVRLWSGIVRGIRHCERSCAHFAYCGGGAAANKLYEHGDAAAGETLYCRSMLKRPFDAVLRHAEQALGLCA